MNLSCKHMQLARSCEICEMEKALTKSLEDNRMLLLRIDQLKWENEKLKNEVEMLSIDLGMK